MNTSKAIPACQSTFQSKLLVPSSSKSAGVVSIISNARQKSSNGRVTIACSGAPRYDPYTTLGVARGTSKNDVKKAYRRLALRYHPNANGKQHTTNFQLIKLAYETLMNMPAPEFSFETLLSMATPQFEEFEEASLDKSEGPVAVGDDDQWEDWEEWMGWEGAALPCLCLDSCDDLYKSLEGFMGVGGQWMGWEGASGRTGTLAYSNLINNSWEAVGTEHCQDWEEWMGWEGASGTLDYSDHINKLSTSLHAPLPHLTSTCL